MLGVKRGECCQRIVGGYASEILTAVRLRRSGRGENIRTGRVVEDFVEEKKKRVVVVEEEGEIVKVESVEVVDGREDDVEEVDVNNEDGYMAF